VPADGAPNAARRYIVPATAAVAIGAGVAGGYYLHQQSVQHQQAALVGAQFDDSALRQVDPALLKWREVGTLDTHLASVRGMALLPDGGVAVVGQQTLRIWTRGPLASAAAAEFRDVALSSTPTAVAADAHGGFVVGLRDHLEFFAADGTRQAVWPALAADSAGSKPWITCVTATPHGIFAADAGRRVVVQYDSNGQVVAEFGREDAAKHAPGIIAPSPHLDVALVESATSGGQPTIWLSNPGRHQLEAYDPTGNLLESWGKSGTTIDLFTGCCNPTDFAIFKDGRFVTAEKGTPRVKIYRPDGQLENVVAGPESFLPDTAGIDVAVDESNRVWILDTGHRTVRVFEPKP
jgi:hypothetical protein